MIHIANSLFIPWFQLGPWALDRPFSDGSYVIYPFPAFVISALVIGYVVALLFAQANSRSIPLTMSLALYLVAFSFPVSHLLNGLLYEPAQFFALVSTPGDLPGGALGWSMYGGIAGTLLGAWIWKWRQKAAILEIGESFAFAGPFGWTVARAGCFVTHDHPGRATDFFLAVEDFRAGAAPYVPRHDMGLYDMIVLGLIAAAFLVLARKRRPIGFYVGLLPVLYAPCRFALDFLRAPASEGGDIRYLALTPAQYGSALLLFAGIATLRRVHENDRRG